MVAGESDYSVVTASDVKVAVNDDDAAPGGITLSVDETSIAEDAATATVTVTATVSGGTTYASAQTVTVIVGDDADSATEGTDYANVAKFDIVIGAGSTSASKTFNLDPEDDVLDENTERLSINGESGDLAISGTSIDITDNDAAPTITMSVSPAEVSEDADPTKITVTATLGGGTRFAAQQTLKVTAGTSTPGEGEAKAGTDHTSVAPFDLTITAGAASGEAEFTLTLIDDTIFELTEQVPVNGELTGVTVTGTAVTINEDDSAPTALTFKAKIGEGDASHTVSEGVETAPTITVTATLTGAVTFSTDKTVTVTVGDADDTATVEDDYKAVGEFSITILAESSSGTGSFTFTPVDDAIDEEDESVSINGALGDNDSVALASITITDNDTRGISVSPVTLTLAEVDDPLTQNTSEHQKTYTVALDSEPTGTVTVNLSSADTKIATISDTSLEFTASDWDAQTVTVTAVPDALDNVDDARTVRITHRVSAAGTDYEDESAQAVDVTVTDDDGEPTLSIDSPSVTEGDSSTTTMTFKVTLSAASGKQVSVDYADTGTGTATSATDYAAITAGTLTFVAGETEKTVNVTVNGDTTDEPNETVVVRLSSASNAGLSGGKTTLDGTGTLNDDDAQPTVSVADASAVTEGNDSKTTVNMSFTVSLDALSGKDVKVPYTLSGTASATDDYTEPNPKTVTIAAGSRSTNIDIAVKDDTLDEPDETIIVTLGAPTHATVSSTQGAGTATGTITDDDAAPTVSVANATAVPEGNDPETTVDMSFTVALDAASGKTITVPYTLTGTATGGSDYETPATTSLSIAAGDVSGTIVIKVKGDTLNEPNETVIVTLSAPTHATVSTTDGAGTGTGTITDNDATPTATLKLSSNSITENSASSTVTATLSGTSSQAVTLTVAAAAVSPADDGDITLSANKILTVAAGETTSSGAVTITAVDNAVDAANKTFTVSATATGGNNVANPDNVTLTITDDDTRGVTVAGSPLSMAEVDNNGTAETREDQASYTVVLDSEPTDDVQVNINAPSMVTVSPAQLTFTASNWNQAQTVTVTAVNDDIDNDGDARTGDIAHAVVARSSDYTGETADKVAVTVTDDDGEPALSINSPSVTEGDSSTTTMTFKVTLAPASGKAVSVDYADAGTGTATSATDYAAITSGTLTFTAGQTEKTVAVTVNGDELDEPNETVVLRLSSASNAALSGGKATLDGTGTINDDDAEPTVSVADASAVNEGNSDTVNMNFTVHLSAASAKTITVPYTLTGTATGGSDYETPASTSLSIPAGDTSGAIVIKVKGDTLDETNETIIVTLNALTHATVSSTQGAGTASGTINDDDDAPSVSIANAAAVNEGNDPKITANMSFTVSVSAASAKKITVPYTLTGTATGGSDYETPLTTSLSIPAGDTSGTIVIKVKGDVLDEPNETIIVTLDAPTHATVSTTDGAGTGTGTITDDDATPTVTLKLSSASITENGGTSTVTASLSGTSSQVVTLTVGATAVSPAVTGDLTLSANKTLTIAAGATTSSGTVTLTAVDNDVDAANKTFTISGDASGGNGVGDPANTTLTITNDDTRGVTVTGGPLSMAEVDNTETEEKEHQSSYTVVLDSEPTHNVQVNISAPSMVTVSPTQLTFTTSNWNQAQTVTVTAVNDTADNPGDVRTGYITHAVVAGSSDYTNVSAARVAVTVNDDDGEPALSIDSPSVTEGDNGTRTMTFKVTLAPASGKAVSVDYADANTGTATSATDYATITTGTLNFAAGQTEKTVSVTVNGDELDEPNETIVLRLSSPSNAALSGGKATLDGTGTITDDDATPTVALKLSSSSITENGGSSTVSATLSGTSSQAVTLTVATTPVDQAVAGDLTLSTNKTLTIAAGATTSTGTVTLTAADNDVDALNKTFTVSAVASGGNNVANPDSVALTITDDDTRGISVSPVVLTLDEVDNPETLNISEHQKTYTVALDSEPTGTVTVNVSSGDTNIATVSDTSLEFTPSDWGAQTVTVTAVDDDVDNTGDARTVRITHTVSAAGTDYEDESAANVDVTLTDDDGEPTLSIDSPNVTEGDNSTTTMTFKVTLAPASGKAVSVDYADAATGTATSATDYAAITSGTLTFTAGQTEKTVAVTVNGDELDEPNETVVLRLSSASNAALSGGKATLDGTGTINDDDAEPTVSVADASAVNEGNSDTVNMNFTVHLSAASAKTITVPYTLTGTATGGSDYETPASTSLSIPAGDTSGTIVIKVKGDTLDEPNETIIVTLNAPDPCDSVKYTRLRAPPLARSTMTTLHQAYR